MWPQLIPMLGLVLAKHLKVNIFFFSYLVFNHPNQLREQGQKKHKDTFAIIVGVFLFLVIRAQNFFRLLGFLRRCLRLGLLPSSGIYCLPERQTRGQKQQQVRPISIFTELSLLFDKNRTSFMRRHLEGLKRKFPPKPSVGSGVP